VETDSGIVVDHCDAGRTGVVDRDAEVDVSDVALMTLLDVAGGLGCLRHCAEKRRDLCGAELVDLVQCRRNGHVDVPEATDGRGRTLELLHVAGGVEVDVRAGVGRQCVADLATLLGGELRVAVPGVDEPILVGRLVGGDGLVAHQLQGSPGPIRQLKVGDMGAVERVDADRLGVRHCVDRPASGGGQRGQAKEHEDDQSTQRTHRFLQSQIYSSLLVEVLRGLNTSTKLYLYYHKANVLSTPPKKNIDQVCNLC